MRILIIDNDLAQADILAGHLESAAHNTAWASNGDEGLEACRNFRPDMVVLGAELPDGSCLDIMPRLLFEEPGLAVFIASYGGSAKQAVRCMKTGAENYVEKPYDLEELGLLIQKAGEKITMRRQLEDAKRHQREHSEANYVFLESPSMRGVYRQLEQAAGRDLNVLISGETGTGKEPLARFLHSLSPRFARPLVDLNCAALSETLIESELFGHEGGSFTDARGMKKGLFEVANGGTIFLDEIGELSLRIQAKLLKVLEQHTARRLGGIQPIPLNFRLVSATNRDLKKEVAAGRFRADLYYRINVVNLQLAPLRERPGDIGPLAEFFFKQACFSFDRAMKPLSPEVLKALQAYSWPGNIRELKNVVERAVLVSEGSSLGPADFPIAPGVPAPSSHAGGFVPDTIKGREDLVHLLNELHWKKAKVAETLGISRPTLLKLLKSHDLY